MSGLLDALFGAEGCTVDGTMGHNPIAMAIEQTFDHIDSFQSRLQGGDYIDVDDAMNGIDVYNFDETMTTSHDNTFSSYNESSAGSWGMPLMPQSFHSSYPAYYAPQMRMMMTV